MFRVLCLLLPLFLPSLGWAVPWVLDPATTVAVDVGWQGRTVEVRFPRLDGEIDFDENRPDRARATISVAARAATTGVGPVDGLVRSRDYLDAERFPAITFRLDRLVQTSPQTADVYGQITLRGVTRPMRFKAKVFRYGPAKADPGRFEAGFDLDGVIDRTAFGSTGGLPEVAAVLPVRIHLLMRSK